MNKLALPLLLLTVWTSSALAASKADMEISDSIKQSKEQGIFTRAVPVSPKSFEWEGHRAEVNEAWLERGGEAGIGSQRLVFSFILDGQRDTEGTIAHKEDKYIELAREGATERDQPRFFWYKSPLSAAIGGREKRVIHYLVLSEKLPNSVTLAVGTRFYPVKGSAKPDSHKSGTSLVFQLKPQ